MSDWNGAQNGACRRPLGSQDADRQRGSTPGGPAILSPNAGAPGRRAVRGGPGATDPRAAARGRAAEEPVPAAERGPATRGGERAGGEGSHAPREAHHARARAWPARRRASAALPAAAPDDRRTPALEGPRRRASAPDRPRGVRLRRYLRRRDARPDRGRHEEARLALRRG